LKWTSNLKCIGQEFYEDILTGIFQKVSGISGIFPEFLEISGILCS
jgi:hypothetical protein